MPTMTNLARYTGVLHESLLICGWRLLGANQSMRKYQRGNSTWHVWLSSRGQMAIGESPAVAQIITRPEEFVKAAAGQASRPGTVDAGFIAAACEWLGFHQLNCEPRGTTDNG